MFVIFGSRTFKGRAKGTTKDVIACGRCGRETQWELVSFWSWFTLFFIPIVPFWVKKVVLCPSCESGVKMARKNREELLAGIDVISV